MFNSFNDTFVNLCANGEVLIEEIDDFVDQWHEGNYQEDLHEFLGMTWKEYSLWVTKPDVLPFIITAHKENKDIDVILDIVKKMPVTARNQQPA